MPARSLVEFVPGTSPVVITVPHGGYERPETIADRTVGCMEHDYMSQELARCICDRLAGEMPVSRWIRTCSCACLHTPLLCLDACACLHAHWRTHACKTVWTYAHPAPCSVSTHPHYTPLHTALTLSTHAQMHPLCLSAPALQSGKPHLIITHLNRVKCDVNRSLESCCDGDPGVRMQTHSYGP